MRIINRKRNKRNGDFGMPTYEGFRLKLLKQIRTNKVFVNRRRRQLKNTDFTIISNNCWGGMIYESYGLPKQTPTVGLFFMASDYIKFISDLRGYIGGTLVFIDPEDSRWRTAPQVVEDKRFGSYPIGVLSNGAEEIEIFFLHVHSIEDAKAKWERRCNRINWHKMLIKFNDQNGCTEEDIEAFMKLDIKNKLFFTCKNWSKADGWSKAARGYCYIRQWPKSQSIKASFEPFGKNRHIDITEYLNKM